MVVGAASTAPPRIDSDGMSCQNTNLITQVVSEGVTPGA